MDTVDNKDDLGIRRQRTEKQRRSKEFIVIPIIIFILLAITIGNVTRIVTHSA